MYASTSPFDSFCDWIVEPNDDNPILHRTSVKYSPNIILSSLFNHLFLSNIKREEDLKKCDDTCI
jgi:hypothetical protein